MLYFLYGTDTDARNAEKDRLLAGRAPARIDAASWSAGAIDAHAGSVPLFGEPEAIVIDGVCETEEGRDAFAAKAAVMALSAALFIALEKKATKDLVKRVEKAGGVSASFEKQAPAEKKESPIVFAIADAFSSRDKKAAWTKLIEAYEAGVSPEEIAGTLFWAVKSMILARTAQTAEEAELNPYAFRKSKQAAGAFSESELAALASDMVALYHDAHAGACDFDAALERFILSRA